MRPGSRVTTPAGATGRVVRLWMQSTWAGHGLKPIRRWWATVELANGRHRHFLADELTEDERTTA